jgi:hypothetical protein
MLFPLSHRMVWQTFTPIFLLQLVNLFWYASLCARSHLPLRSLILRRSHLLRLDRYWRIWIILIKAIRGIQIVDDREDGEEEEVAVVEME